jgi:hypothetical protein
MRLAPAIITCALLASAEAGYAQEKCTAHPDNRQVGDTLRLRPGRYRVTLVAITGSQGGSSASGILELRGAGSEEEATWGWINVDFAAVGATVYEEDDQYRPPPSSQDPQRPGVVVRAAQPKAANQVATLHLVMGELRGGLDGAGIYLEIRSILGGGYAGIWDRYGLVADGMGYFCLVRE